MCGLVAMISKKTGGFLFNDAKLFEQMLYANALRGMDSTGIFGVNKYGNLSWAKCAKPSADFIKTKTFEDMKSNIFSQYKIMVGHNRAATKGATTDENAHPFVEDHICLVHNGTIHGHKHLANTDVDSHAVTKAFAKEGYLNVLPKINGAFALIWYDAKDKKLRIARNDQRPLWLIQTDDADYIASEPTMLLWLVQRVYNKVITPVYFKTEHIYSYDLDNLEEGYACEDMPKKVTPVQKSQIMSIGGTTEQAKKKTTTSHNWKSQPKKGEVTIGDNIFFSYDKSSVQGQQIRVEGTWTGDNKTQVTGYINVSMYSADQIEYILETANMFYGKFVGHSKKTNGQKVYFCSLAHPVLEWETLTGALIDDQQLIEYGHCCDSCGTIIDPEVEEGEFWVRFGGTTDIKGMLCSSCVEKHAYLSKTLENKRCTKESSSSVTSLVPLQ